MPNLNVRAMAKMLRLPVAKQERILFEQKYPKGEPQRFQTPYYGPALAAIRNYYRSNNSPSSLVAARAKIEGIGQETRRLNNYRVLEKFQGSILPKRKLMPTPNSRHSAHLGDVQLKLSPDLQALEKNTRKIFYFNCRGERLDDELARYTLEIGLWVFDAEGIPIGPTQIEFMDLFTGRLHTVSECRPTTLAKLAETANTITEIWPNL